MENGESLVSFCPPLPHAWELEGWPVDEVHRTGCELRRSPGLAGEFGPVSGPVRGLPTMTPGFPDPNGPDQTVHRSDWRSLDSAVQSRVGDGFLVVFPCRFSRV